MTVHTFGEAKLCSFAESETWQDIDNAFRLKADASVKLFDLRKKFTLGTVTMSDAAQYQTMLSQILGQTIGEKILQIPENERVKFLDWILRNQYHEANDRLAVVQRFLDAQRGIRIKAQKAPFPEERVHKLGRALTDQTVSESTLQRRARAGTETVAKSFHDDYIRENAKFRANAGLKCWIVRTTDGNCCKWCTQVAGRYEYGTEPDDVYRRHDNCGCITVYENGRMRQDVWSKKWEVPEAGAGAKKPTILTPAQGRALQAKHQPTVLTRGSGSGIIQLPDIQIGRSLGAKSKNYDIMDLSTGEIFHLVEGSRLQNVEVFCGKGTKTIFRDAEKYALRYGGETQDWQHAKGIGLVDYFGEEIAAELHWVQCEGIGRFEFFVKEWLE